MTDCHQRVGNLTRATRGTFVNAAKRKNDSHKKYAGDCRNVAGEREMGPLCGSLPRDAETWQVCREYYLV